MLDINLIRQKPELVREGLRSVGAEAALLDRVLELDRRWRAAVARSEQLRAEQRRASAELKSRPAGAGEREQARVRLRELGQRAKEAAAEADELRRRLDGLMLELPNLPHPDVPPGRDERDNVVVRTEGSAPRMDFEPRPHWELGEALGILDFERGVRMSGSRFYVLMGAGALLQRALIAWMLDLHVLEHGYQEAYPPALVKEACLVGTGNLPKFRDNLYRDAEDDLWLIPTAEVPLTNLHRDEVLSADELPKRYVAYTPCFRREKMSAGKDVRGIKRGHQFDKVELMKHVRPEEAEGEFRALLADAEDVCRRLGLHYRIVEMCTGDLSFVACRKFDIEVWAAGCREWLEVSSCSMFGEFQARRANIRYRPAPGEKPRYVHTMNGSGLALPRTMIAVLENYQRADGSVVVPEVLRPYMRGMQVIEPRRQ